MNNPSSDQSEFNRRDFIKGSSFAALMTMLGGVELTAQTPPATESAATDEVGPTTKVAVIGLGAWGREILDQLNRLELKKPHAEVVALCDNYPAFLRRAGTKVPKAAQVADYKEILANKDVQSVIVATPSYLHKEIAIAALAAGKHVYCEAPLAVTIEDARAIALAARDAVGQVFQPGLQMRSDPQRHFLLPFIRSGALGKSIMARAQWHKKDSWRAASPNPEREKALNWRLNAATSPGLVGEIGIHALDQTGWFLRVAPVSVTGFSSLMFWKDGRDVPDTVQLVLEYPDGLRMIYDATLANSFDGEYENYYGSDAAVMMRKNKAWMFKEADAPLLGWEVYARRDTFFRETGIALVAGGSKQDKLAEKATDDDANAIPPLYYALESFCGNCVEISNAVDDFTASFGAADKKALAENLAGIKLRNAANYKEGYAATVLALKANEAVVKGEKITLQKEWFELT